MRSLKLLNRFVWSETGKSVSDVVITNYFLEWIDKPSRNYFYVLQHIHTYCSIWQRVIPLYVPRLLEIKIGIWVPSRFTPAYTSVNKGSKQRHTQELFLRGRLTIKETVFFQPLNMRDCMLFRTRLPRYRIIIVYILFTIHCGTLNRYHRCFLWTWVPVLEQEGKNRFHPRESRVIEKKLEIRLALAKN